MRRINRLHEAGKYENPLTSKEEILASMVASYFAEDMADVYPDISQKELDAAEKELYGALIDTGALYGREMENAHAGDYQKLLDTIEQKLRKGEYSSEFGDKGMMNDPLVDDEVDLADQARADKAMGSPDSYLVGTPEYDEAYDEEEVDFSDEYKQMVASGKPYDKLNESFSRNDIRDFFRKFK